LFKKEINEIFKHFYEKYFIIIIIYKKAKVIILLSSEAGINLLSIFKNSRVIIQAFFL